MRRNVRHGLHLQQPPGPSGTYLMFYLLMIARNNYLYNLTLKPMMNFFEPTNYLIAASASAFIIAHRGKKITRKVRRLIKVCEEFLLSQSPEAAEIIRKEVMA